MIQTKRKKAKKQKSGCLSKIVLLFLFFALFSTLSGGTKTQQEATQTEPYTTEQKETPTPSLTSTPSSTPITTQTATPTPEPSSMEIHFLDVGQGDAALVLCDGKSMLIDGGGSDQSSLIYTYLKEQEISHLDYIVATHGHEDHVGGLSGALNYATVGTALSSVSNYDSEEFGNFIKYLGSQNVSIKIPAVGEQFELGSAEVSILSPSHSYADHNNESLVLRIIYGKTSFLFMGDAEKDSEQEMLSTGNPIQSTVLKVGHHGAADAATVQFLQAVAPQYAVISVGKGNAYEHPLEETLTRLKDASTRLYRTDLQGHIICTSDGNTVSFNVEKNEDAEAFLPQATPTPSPTPAPKEKEPEGTDYVGNKNSRKFHYAWCSSVGKMKESNKYYFTGTREQMIKKGYSPCQNCKP